MSQVFPRKIPLIEAAIERRNAQTRERLHEERMEKLQTMPDINLQVQEMREHLAHLEEQAEVRAREAKLAKRRKKASRKKKKGGTKRSKRRK